MSAQPFDLPAAFARMWVDGSIQMMRATTELWTNLLDTAPRRSTSSTASPWWMPPQEPRQTALAATVWPAAFAPGAWAASWPQSMMPAFPSPTAGAFLPWFANLGTAPTSNPFFALQQAWLQASAPPMRWPWQPAEPPATTEVWHPIATAYRTANGHAMAAILRTMADVVEPKSNGFTPGHYWPTTLGTRH